MTPFPAVGTSPSDPVPEVVGTELGTADPPPGTGPDSPQVKTSLQMKTSLQILRSLDSGPHGLVEARAEERLTRFGENVLPAWRPVSRPRRFVRSLWDPFTSVLLCLGLVSAVVSPGARPA